MISANKCILGCKLSSLSISRTLPLGVLYSVGFILFFLIEIEMMMPRCLSYHNLSSCFLPLESSPFPNTPRKMSCRRRAKYDMP